MPSRKREKGRQRKAKAKANAEGDLSWEEYVQRRKRVDRHGKCLHTILAERLADPSHPSNGFMNAYIEIDFERKKAEFNFHKFVRNLFLSFPVVTNDESHRKILRGILLSIGTDATLNRSESAINICGVVLLLEQYKGNIDTFDPVFHSVLPKIRDINGGSWRDAIRFYTKRISCSCLKQLYAQSKKKEVKVGVCFTCNKTFARTSLMICG